MTIKQFFQRSSSKNRSSLKQRVSILWGGVVLWMGVFLVVNPEFSRSLMSDVSPSSVIKNYKGDFGYVISSSKLTLVSNRDIPWLQKIHITLAHNPEKEILIKKPQQVTIEKQGPSMTTYIFDISTINVWDTIAVFDHNASKEDVSIWNIELFTDDAKILVPSISLVR